MTNHTFPTITDTADLVAVVQHANGTLRTASMTDGTIDETTGLAVLRPATRAELNRAERVGLAAIRELDRRGVTVSESDQGWLRIR